MSQVVGQVFWLALPVALTGILHMVVVMVDLFPSLKLPLDGGRTLGGKRIFGDNKTWRGVAFMVLGTVAVALVQGAFGGPWADRSDVAVLDLHGLATSLGIPEGRLAYAVGYAVLNAVLGFGYALGELPNSFAKRRLEITPGKTRGGLLGACFFLLDQADSVIAALVIGALVFGFSWTVVWVGVACLTGLHLFLNASLYLLRIRKNL